MKVRRRKEILCTDIKSSKQSVHRRYFHHQFSRMEESLIIPSRFHIYMEPTSCDLNSYLIVGLFIQQWHNKRLER